jgi:hypothetical protein
VGSTSLPHLRLISEDQQNQLSGCPDFVFADPSMSVGNVEIGPSKALLRFISNRISKRS